MKLATYNLWSSDAGMPHRQVQITDTLTALRADLLCLQENFIGDALSPMLPYLPYYAHHPDMELSVFSRYPIMEHRQPPYALLVRIQMNSLSLCIVNVHLPWQSALAREEAIVAITDAAAAQNTDHILLAGDFNCSDTSAVHRYLCGEQSLSKHDAYYFDLAEAHAVKTHTQPPPTLAFRENPRWGVIDPPNTLERDQRFDRILLANPYPAPAPTLSDVGIFGTEISDLTGLAPSDHWGVYACLDF